MMTMSLSVRQEAVLTRAMCLPTFSHFLIVNKTSLSLTHTLIPISQEDEEADCRGSMLRLSFLLLLLLLQPLRVALRLGSAQECALSFAWVIDYMTKKGGRSTADALAFNHSTSPSMYMALPWAPRDAPSSWHLCLSVCDEELWQVQALARVIEHIGDAVVSARPCLQGPVRASLHTVIVLAELPAPVAEFLSFQDLVGLEWVAAQHLDQEQVAVRAILVRLQALDVCGPVDVARVVAVAGLLRRGAPLQVKALRFAILLPCLS
jgi:hypothetical protein